MKAEDKIWCKSYISLPEEARQLREEVFVREQGFSEEFDETDQRAVHLLFYEGESEKEKGGKAVGVCRYYKGEEPGSYWIGRLAVSKEKRGLYLGERLVLEAQRRIAEEGGRTAFVSAQVRAEGFYERLGFVREGEVYLDEYCEHIRMRKALTVDLLLFMGQSNMAGRGVSCERWPQKAPALTPGAGWEYRSVSDPGRLHVIEEPFGREENTKDGINDGEMKTGSMVTSFVNAYYEEAGIPVVALSASKGGSSILQWQPEGAFMADTEKRLAAARRFLEKTGQKVRHTFVIWCQGETDGDHHMSGADYQKYFQKFFHRMKELSAERCFLIPIGAYNGSGEISYDEIRKAQYELALPEKEVVIAATGLQEMKERGLMKDAFHYYQAAYNEIGREAGKTAGACAAALEP